MTKGRIKQPGETDDTTRCNHCYKIVKDKEFANHWASCPVRQKQGLIEPVPLGFA